MKYEIVRNRPAAKFFYKGTHSRPVKRTVVITEQNRNTFSGYEIREGATVRDWEEAPIKSFRKDKIATTSQLRKDNPLYSDNDESTLERMSIDELVENGY